MKKVFKLGIILLAVAGIAAGCSKADSKGEDVKKVKLGVVGEDTDVWDDVKSRLEKEGIEIEYVKFTDYNTPNTALADGSIDLNSFQTQIFLDNFNAETKSDLVSIGNTVNAPLGIYSDKIKSVDEVEDGAEVTIANDVTNGGRALNLLQTAGLIKLAPDKGQTPTVSDITENKKNLDIKEIDASQTPRTLQDVTLAVINNGVAVDAGLNPGEDPIFKEPLDDSSKPYVNIIVSRKEDADNETYQKVVDAYQTDETKKVIEEKFKGSIIPSWDTFGKK